MLQKSLVFDYDKVLTSTLLSLGGEACLDRFNRVLKTRAIEESVVVEKPKNTYDFSAAGRRAAYAKTTEQLRIILTAGKVTNPIYIQYLELRCMVGMPEVQIKEQMLGTKVNLSSFVSNLLRHEGRKLI